MSMEEISSKIKELRELKRMQEELADEIGTLEDEIKAHMTATQTDTITTAEYKVTWKTVTTNRIDTTALKKALPDVAERFTKTTTSKRFTVA